MTPAKRAQGNEPNVAGVVEQGAPAPSLGDMNVD